MGPEPELQVVAARLPLEGLRLLVVDDEEPAREVLRAVLEAEGASVFAASSADEAWRRIDEWRPDAMLVDIGMPVVNGFTFVEQLRTRSDVGETIPVAALTGYVSEEDRARALRVGFQAYLVKPVDPAELIHTIKSLVHRCD